MSGYTRPALYRCHVCGETGGSTILATGAHILVRCPSCHIVGLWPRPSEAELTAAYAEGYWDAPAKIGRPGLAYRLRMSGVARRLASLAKGGARLLDMGSGDGAFLRLAESFGLDAWGIDRYAPAGAGSRQHEGDFTATGFESGYFQLVTMFHVLEHLPDPRAALAEAHRLLAVDGVLMIEVPNADSLVLALAGRRWQPLEIPTHLSFFSTDSLNRLVESVGTWELLSTSHFSWRASPAALVLTVLPGLQPKAVRRRNGGRYPVALAAMYLVLQILAIPAVAGTALLGRGCIIRMIFRKKQ